MSQPVVLIAEDDRDLQELLWLNLRMSGVAVLTASDGPSALRLAREHAPAAIVLDVMMPGLDGLSVLRNLRADPATAAIPVVVVTACSKETQIWDGWQAGADHYLTKPVRLQSLIDLITRIVDGTATAQAG